MGNKPKQKLQTLHETSPLDGQYSEQYQKKVQSQGTSAANDANEFNLYDVGVQDIEAQGYQNDRIEFLLCFQESMRKSCFSGESWGLKIVLTHVFWAISARLVLN